MHCCQHVLSANANDAKEARKLLERLVPPDEAHILRLQDEGRSLLNELAEMRFKHYELENNVQEAANEVAVLSAKIARSQADRAYLDAHGSLPPPELPAVTKGAGTPAGPSR